MRRVLLLALMLAGCDALTGADEHLLATIPGTWQASALDGQFTLSLTQGEVSTSTGQAPVAGSGTFSRSGNTVTFTVTGFVSPSGGQGDSQLRNVELDWTMPYLQHPDRQFHFSGGLEEVTEAGSRLVGFLRSPERPAPCPPMPQPCSPNPNPPDPTVDVQVAFVKQP